MLRWGAVNIVTATEHVIERMKNTTSEMPDEGRKAIIRDRFSRELRSFSRQAGAWRYQENGRSRSGPPQIRH